MQSHVLHVSRPSSPIPNGVRLAIERRETQALFTLPPGEETLALIQHFFASTGVLFPYIHENSFLNTYFQMRATTFHTVKRSWLGLLNIILAMATSTSSTSNLCATERTEASDIFFCRARALCDKQIRHGTSLEVGKIFCGIDAPYLIMYV